MLRPVIGLMAENRGYLRNGMEDPVPGKPDSSHIYGRNQRLFQQWNGGSGRGPGRMLLVPNGLMKNGRWRMEMEIHQGLLQLIPGHGLGIYGNGRKIEANGMEVAGR